MTYIVMKVCCTNSTVLGWRGGGRRKDVGKRNPVSYAHEQHKDYYVSLYILGEALPFYKNVILQFPNSFAA